MFSHFSEMQKLERVRSMNIGYCENIVNMSEMKHWLLLIFTFLFLYTNATFNNNLKSTIKTAQRSEKTVLMTEHKETQFGLSPVTLEIPLINYTHTKRMAHNSIKCGKKVQV